jgi:hypothetical protein
VQGSKTPARWSSPTVVEPSGNGTIQDVACTAGSKCWAVDGGGNILASTNKGPWTVVDSVNSVSFQDISCPTSTFCLAVDEDGSAVDLTGSKWSQPGYVPNGGVLDISCVSSKFCMGLEIDNEFEVFTGSTTNWSSSSIETLQGELDAVSCPIANFCLAVGDGGLYATFNGMSWKTGVLNNATDAADDPPNLGEVSCASVSFCVATDAMGYAYTFNGSSWNGGAAIPGIATGTNSPDVLISCAADDQCVGVDTDGDAEVLANGKWSIPVDIDGSDNPNGLSCFSPTGCGAVDNTDNVVFFG